MHAMQRTARFLTTLFLATSLGLAQEGGAAKPQIPEDLIDNEHVREELGVNEFTAPSIAKVFETLEKVSPLPASEIRKEMPKPTPLNRADLAVELGFLIADGFLIVQSGELSKVEPLAEELSRYGKALGAGDRVKGHAASLIDSAKQKKVDQLKKELTATQKDVERELLSLRDADLAHLISLGGWIRALEVSTLAVEKDFSVERAKVVMREDIADYYTQIVGSLEPQISERPKFMAVRDILSGLRTEMTLREGEQPTPARVADLRKAAVKLVENVLKRDSK